MSESKDPKHAQNIQEDAEKTAEVAAPGGVAADAAATSADPEPLQVLSPDGSIAETQEDLEARLAMEGLMRHRRQRRRKKIIAGSIVGGIILIGAVVWGVQAYNASKPAVIDTSLTTTYVEYGDFAESVSATGSAEPVSSVVVTPEVTGTIESVNVAEGDTVAAGDVLLTIKNDDLDKAVRDAELAVRDAKLNLESAVNDYNSLVDTYNAGADISDSEFDKASFAIETAKNAVSDQQEAYNQAVANAEKRTVRAPAAGSVVAMSAQVGASVADAASKGSLVQIADLSQMTVKVQVNEVDISKISVGQAATATFSALPGVALDAQVTRISTVSSSGDNSSSYYGSGGVVTYDVSLLIPAPVAELKPGMTANVDITLQSVPATLMVPASCVGTDSLGKSFVMVVTDAATQACEKRAVEIAASDQTTVAISGDVTVGDEVLLDPYATGKGFGSDEDLPMLSTDGGETDAAGVAADGAATSDGAATTESAAAPADAE